MVSTDEPDVDAQSTVGGLRQEHGARSEPGEPRKAGRAKRVSKKVASWVLIVLACILAVVSVFTVFVRNEVLNTDTYVNTVAPLASNPAIQAAVAQRVSKRLVAQTNLEQQVKQALPARAGFLATPITSGLQSAADQVVLKFVQSSAFQKLWVEANRRSHQQVVALLTGSKQGALQSSNGEITVDLSQVEAQAKKRLDAKGITVFDKVPAVHGSDLVLFQSKQLKSLQRLIRLFDDLAFVLPIITLLCFAVGIILTENRRRGLVRAALALALSMGVILVLASVLRNQYLLSLSASQSKEAASAVVDTVGAVLLDTVRTILIVAALVALGALVAGNSHFRSWLRERRRPAWMTSGPVHDLVAAHRKGMQWGVLGAGLVVLVVWNNPTIFVAVVVVLIALAGVGVVGLFSGSGPAGAVAGPGPGARGSTGRTDGAGEG